MREAPQMSEPSATAPTTAPTSSKPDLPPPPLEPEPEWVSALEPLTVPVQPVQPGLHVLVEAHVCVDKRNARVLDEAPRLELQCRAAAISTWLHSTSARPGS